MNVELFTVATHDTPGFQRLQRSLGRFSIPLTVVGWGEEFPGFGWRFKKLVDAIRRRPVRTRFIAHCDAFDTVCLAPIEVLVSRFMDQFAPIVFSCEWQSEPREPMLNPGLFIAETDAFMDVFGGNLEELMPHHFNDMFQLQYLWKSQEQCRFQLDGLNQCFFTQGARRLVPVNDRLVDPFSYVAPCFVHGPNGADLSNVDEWLMRPGREVSA